MRGDGSGGPGVLGLDDDRAGGSAGVGWPWPAASSPPSPGPQGSVSLSFGVAEPPRPPTPALLHPAASGEARTGLSPSQGRRGRRPGAKRAMRGGHTGRAPHSGCRFLPLGCSRGKGGAGPGARENAAAGDPAPQPEGRGARGGPGVDSGGCRGRPGAPGDGPCVRRSGGRPGERAACRIRRPALPHATPVSN